ncbi:MAG: ATP-binding cassette domain-containing protein, partial [Calditrichaeota bacterium]
EEVHARVVSAFADVELDFERFKDRSPCTLSEGEKRRAAIAGVLAMQPELLVLDEPTAGLDHNGLLSVVQILRKLHTQGKSIVLISHDLDLVAALVERIVVLQAGRIRFDGPRAKLLQDHRLMAQLDLTPPRTQRVVQALKRKGLVRNEDLYSLEEIKKEIARTCGVIQNKPVVEK